jgi:hypothetical protein
LFDKTRAEQSRASEGRVGRQIEYADFKLLRIAGRNGCHHDGHDDYERGEMEKAPIPGFTPIFIRASIPAVFVQKRKIQD